MVPSPAQRGGAVHVHADKSVTVCRGGVCGGVPFPLVPSQVLCDRGVRGAEGVFPHEGVDLVAYVGMRLPSITTVSVGKGGR